MIMENYIRGLNEQIKLNNIDDSYAKLCIEYAERLIQNNLPVIFDREHLALLLGIDYNYINKAMLFTDKFYKIYNLKKKSGGYREISIPNVRLRYIQRWILDNIIYKIGVHKSVTGFIPEKSILDNACSHVNKDLVLTIDIKDFFPTVNFERVFNVFYYYGYTKEVSYCLARICTLDKRLPQGAPTSPYLANIICTRMDNRIYRLCEKIGANYTRYADDITISGEKGVLNYLNVIQYIVVDEGFEVNDKKTRAMYKNRQQLVTGLVVNDIVSVPKNKIRYLRQQIFFIKKYGVSKHLKQSKSSKSNIREHLYGLAYFIKMINEEKGLNYINELDSINWDS